jgi:hypothetical protein
MLFLTAPTRGSRPELLGQLIEASGLPASQVVLVRTSPDAVLPAEVSVIDDFGPINIQRWWNVGIAAAAAAGATAVAVANDDLAIGPGALQELALSLANTGASIATPGSRYRLWRGGWPFVRRLDGALWVIGARSPIRPDEDFRWAFGDDDLDVRCRLRGQGVLTVPVDARNVHHNEESARNPLLQELSKLDRRTFRRNHPWVSSSRLPIDAARWLVRHGRPFRTGPLPEVP